MRAIPTYRAFCGDCFNRIPWRLRADMLNAHTGRIINKARYEETLIRLRQWEIGYVGGNNDAEK